MTNAIRFRFVAVLASGFLFSTAPAQVQPNVPATPLRYKDMVAENPTAESDLKVVGDFINALVSGDQDKARSLVSPGFMAHGPAPTDSADMEKTMKNWQANYKLQQDRKVGFVAQTFRVLSGGLKGNWVSVWGDYTFTQAGKTLTFPFQYTASVADGKIKTDRIYYDRLYTLQQLGYKLTPPEIAKK